jgi:phosphoribosylaminoimidazole-succinocarboxamide synthase
MGSQKRVLFPWFFDIIHILTLPWGKYKRKHSGECNCMETGVLKQSNFSDIKLLKRGKVREVYEVNEHLLIVASDRISAFDVVMEDPIPDKGKILTQISLFWFEKLASIVENHIVSSNPEEYPQACRKYAPQLKGRSMLVKKTQPLAVECIVRGYLSGSGWQEYSERGSVCGIPLPEGLKESQRLPQPIFTPSTKAEEGLHDENISYEEAVKILGRETAEEVKRLSLEIYAQGSRFAAEKGIIIADTKFEFGLKGGRLILIDEVLTPDSSRFWPEDEYRPGGPQKSFDKQFLRDYLVGIRWPKSPPPPVLPPEIVEKTREKYLEALNRLTGKGLEK